MNEKEYPMSDEYNEYAAQLLDSIDMRDRVLAAMKNMTPEQRREVQETLKVVNENIEDLEKSLAKQYEAYQMERRAEERKNELGNDLWRRMLMMYVVIKHRMPEELDKFTKNLDNLSPEGREEFLDQVAIMETYDLDNLIAKLNS